MNYAGCAFILAVMFFPAWIALLTRLICYLACPEVSDIPTTNLVRSIERETE